MKKALRHCLFFSNHKNNIFLFICFFVLLKLFFIFQETFQSEVMTFSGSMSPFLVCFHATWGHDVHAYINALQRSADEFKQLGATVKYGSVDLRTQHEGKCDKFNIHFF